MLKGYCIILVVNLSNDRKNYHTQPYSHSNLLNNMAGYDIS